MTSKKEREFNFTDRDFSKIQTLVSQHTGIVLSEAKRDMVYSRLARRLRQLNLKDFKDYCHIVENETCAEELTHFTNAITTNLTAFYREPHHFQYLKTKLLPELMRRNAATKTIRLWSAGCSTGEEPYTLAMAIRDVIPENSGWDVRILATDLDTNVLNTGSNGVYGEERVKGLDKKIMRKWFLRGKNGMGGSVRVSPSLQEMISFRQLNLMTDWPMKGPFDFIFCRNVVIYFDKPTQSVLFDRYADLLIENGHLFLGHSETMFKTCNRFELIGNTIYKKKM